MLICEFENGNKASLRHVAVDILVIKDGQVLMVKRAAKLLEGGKWGLTGGFMDRDETIREAAKREAYEESGWEVDDFKLLTIVDDPNRYGEDRQNVVFVFIAKALKLTGKPDWEQDEVKWFNLDDLPPKEQVAFDHMSLIELYKRYLKEKLTLPIL